jgi:hypothetical protein
MKPIAILHIPNDFTKESVDKLVGDLKEQGINKDYYLLVVNDAHDSAYVTMYNEKPVLNSGPLVDMDKFEEYVKDYLNKLPPLTRLTR